MENLTFLFKELIDLPKETQWVEFKHNNKDPQEIGEYISAIANTTALSGKDHGYVVWGVENESHRVLGTSFQPNQEKKGNEELVGWLFSLLHPKIDFHFIELEINHLPIVILEISPAYSQPVQFAGIDYIRIGSYKVNLKNHPEKERALWKLFDQPTTSSLV